MPEDRAFFYCPKYAKLRGMSIIEVRDLYKSYGEVKAVRGVSFAVEKGEIFGILGPNGAGKTTTLEVLEGLNKADSGTVTIAGFDALKQTQEVKHKIGVQLQSESFFDKLQLVELLDLFASFYNKKIEALGLLKKVDLLDKAYAYYKDMSGGQQRRFSIAITLVNQPEILFLDEPTTGLDPQSRRYVWELIKQIRDSGTTVILTTHYMEEAEVLCDRVAIMDHGVIIKTGTPKELISSLPVKNTISFAAEKYVAIGDLELLCGVKKAVRENGVYILETADPSATLYRLLQDAYDRKLDITDLHLHKPTLEDVFIHYTGHALRE